MSLLPSDIPAWVKAVVVVSALPLLGYPWLLSSAPDGGTFETLLYLYPVFVLLACYCALRAWPERNIESVVVLIVLWMSHIAVYYLALY